MKTLAAALPRHRPMLARGLFVLAVAGLLAGCETTGPGPTASAAPAAPPEPPLTRSRAAEQCWMSTEKGRADISLDKRADIVTKCIDDKMKAAQASAPKADAGKN